MPFVLTRSLCAIGMPSPGASSLTWRKQFSSPSRSSIADRYAAKISSDDASPVSSRSFTCCAVRRRVSITGPPPLSPVPPISSPRRAYRRNSHEWVTGVRRLCVDRRASCRRHPEEAGFAVRRVRQRVLDGERWARLVLGPDVDEVERVRGRLDAREVELAHLADCFEDRVQLRSEAVDLVVAQGEPRQPRDVQHLISRNGHANILPKTGQVSARLRSAGPGGRVFSADRRKNGPLSRPA